MSKLAILALAGLPFVALAQPAYAQKKGDKIEGSYVCVFKKGTVGRGNANAEAHRAAQSGGATPKHVYNTALEGFAVDLPEQALERMKAKNPSIAYCEQDQVFTTGPVEMNAPPSGGGVVAMAQETPWGVARVNGGAPGTFATAWVIDSGIQLNHPDLNVDTARSRNFVAREKSANDTNGHGTHVAGTIAALDNGIGVIGVAPGARVVAVRVLNRQGSGTTSGVIAGVDYVAANGQAGDVANMSLGGGVSPTLDNAVINASTRVRFTLAAGNESDHANNHSPARANGPNIYTVSSFAVGDNWSSFSNYGNPPIEYGEPGSSIKSTYLNSGYATMSGTSMAAPHLAGLLLAGAVRSGGVVNGDPAAPADTIGVR